MRCAQKSCRRALTNGKGQPLPVEQVEVLAGCPSCGWKIAINSNRFCASCKTKRLRQNRDLIKENRCLVCKQDHPRSINGRCLYRIFRERGLRGVTAEQIAWFREKVTKAHGREMLDCIVRKNWELIRAIGEARFADDPLKARAAKIRRRSIIGKEPTARKEMKEAKEQAKKQPSEPLSSPWLWNAERRFRRLKKKSW